MNLKVSAGRFKKSNLKVPKSAKPVKNIIKQSAFTVLQEYLKNAKVLDLYAGSGNLGIEALSNGAKFVTFVENDLVAIEVIKENLINLNIDSQAEVYHKDVLKFLGECGADYDIAFADPPYEIPFKHLLKTIHLSLKPKGIFVFFHKRLKEELSAEQMKLVKNKSFGKSAYSIFLKN